MSDEVKVDRNGFIRCRVCGCTQVDACPGGCSWADGNLCSVCFNAAQALRQWRDDVRAARLRPLLREAELTPDRDRRRAAALPAKGAGR